ncbi:MAG: hypothetical protein KGJ90_07200 [Patescibacteria group bacterium]|nr:hypothetical protein [Patescibacteria group bacterium]MDE2233859.1 hypothetical protein [Patescibacteria group bacterium]
MTDYKSVLDFGAQPNGVFDNTAAIQTALNTMSTTGGTLFFPPGNYRVNAPLTIDRTAMTVFSDLTRFSIKGSGKGNPSTGNTQVINFINT